MHIEADAIIGRPRTEVFRYLARAQRLPEYVKGFEWVRQETAGDPSRGTVYRYRMARGGAEGTFEWTEFEPDSKLAWHGSPAKAGIGSMEPSGWWELSEVGGGTRVKLVMAPKPGGIFRLIAPLMAIGMRRGNARALERLKERLEGSGIPLPG